MPRLPGTVYLAHSESIMSRLRPRKVLKSIMKSHRIHIKKYEALPIRIRPWFIAFSCIIMLALAFLGFSNIHEKLPLNDKILHFLCLGSATAVLYWVFDVEEDARRIWFWRRSGLIITGVISLFFGSIISEIVQSALPYKHFQIGDVIANLSGSTIGLVASYRLERYYRHRREINRLYRPLDRDDDSESEDDTLLPTYRQTTSSPNKDANAKQSRSPGQIRLGNVWDEADHTEIFAIDDEDEDDQTPTPRIGSSKPKTQPPKLNTASPVPGRLSPPRTPTIIVSPPSNSNGEWT